MPPGGLVVLSVEKNSGAEKAGIRAGDELLTLGPVPEPGQPPGESVELRLPCDFYFAEDEFAPRGGAVVRGRREGAGIDFRLGSFGWGVVARPQMPPQVLEPYLEGRRVADQRLLDRALALFESARRAAESAGDMPLAFFVKYTEAHHLLKAGEYTRACEAAPEAVSRAEELKNLPAELWALQLLARAQEQAGNLPAADATYARILDAAEQTYGERFLMTTWLQSAAGLRQRKGDLETAEVLDLRALRMAERLHPGSVSVAACLNNLGVIAFRRGVLPGAEDYFRRALAIFEKTEPDSARTASALNNLGSIATRRGDLGSAENYFARSLRIKEKLAPESLEVANGLNNLGAVAFERKDLAAAEDYFHRALDLRTRLLPNSLPVAMNLNNLASVARGRGDLGQARSLCLESLAIREKVAPESLDVATCLSTLSGLSLDLRDLVSARSYSNRALAIRERVVPGSLDVAESLAALGQMDFAEGKSGLARENHAKALAIRQRLSPGSSAVAESFEFLAACDERLGDRARAIADYTAAVEALEAQRGRLGGGREAEQAFTAHHADAFRALVRLQVQTGDPAGAFATLERYRARVLLDMLAERDLDLSRDAPEDLLREQGRLDVEFTRLQDSIAKLHPDKDEPSLEEALRTQRDLDRRRREVGEKIRQASPKLASLQYPKPLDLDGARGALDRETLLLSYCTAAEATYIFALLDGDLKVFEVSTPRPEVARLVAAFRAGISDPAGRGDWRRQGRNLYDLLLRPASGIIRRARTLLICPDGPIHALPMAALMPGRGRYLAEDKPLSNILSVTVLAEGARSTDDGAGAIRMAAFGAPLYDRGGTSAPGGSGRGAGPRGQTLAPLPATGQEVREICQLFGGTCRAYLGPEATEENAKGLDRGIRYLHFACHGILDERFPLNSGLALSSPRPPATENGFLQAWEIFEGLRVDADLVALSACQTGLGAEMGGEGLVGLTRAFQYAGARSVLSTLWSVSDESSSRLMSRFYRHLLAGRPCPEALRLAQVEMIRSSKGKGVRASHPFHWAPFVLNGR